jgi:hypothetical protein
VRPDPDGTADDSKLTSFGFFGSSGKVSDWIADRLADSLTSIGKGGRLFRVGVVTELEL